MLDFSSIYSQDFQYNLPEAVLESFFDGKAFDKKETYTQEEKEQYMADLEAIFEKATSGLPEEKKIAYVSAGAPGSGKTMLVEKKLNQKLEKGKNFKYIDPDEVVLKNMHATFIKQLEENPDQAQEAYDFWRPASNAINHWTLANMIKMGHSFFFGTTSSSPHTGKFFDLLKEKGYEIRVLHMTAPDEVRVESAKNHGFCHTTKQDIVEKGQMIFDRINDTFFSKADKISFYYRKEAHQEGIKAATWVKTEDAKGQWKIHDQQAFEEVIKAHGENWPNAMNPIVARETISSENK